MLCTGCSEPQREDVWNDRRDSKIRTMGRRSVGDKEEEGKGHQEVEECSVCWWWSVAIAGCSV